MAFEAAGGAPQEVLYDRMKTAVQSEAEDGTLTYSKPLVALLDHYGSAPRACRPYRPRTKGKVERPFRYIRQDFFLDRVFRNLDDLNAQFEQWCSQIANSRLHGTTNRVVSEAFAEEQPHVGFWNVLIWISRIVSSRVRRGFPVCSGFPGPHFKHTVEALRL